MSLAVAAWEGDVHRVRELLAAEVDIHIDNRTLLTTVARGHTQIVELLLAANADVHANNDYALIWAVLYGHTQVVELLLLAGANIRVLSLYDQQRFNHLIPIYISIQEYLILEPLIINILELADRYIVDVIANKKYVLLK